MQPRHEKELARVFQKHTWQKHTWRLALLVVLLSCAIGLGYALKTSSAGLPQVRVTPDNLPPGALEAEYKAVLTASGGTTSYVFSLEEAPGEGLPLGLSLEKGVREDVAMIAGTPQEPGIFSFTVKVASLSSLPALKRYTLMIRARSGCLGPGLALVTPVQHARQGAAYSQRFSVLSGTAPYAFDQEHRLSQRLPKGLELKPDSAKGQVTLAGAPEEVGGQLPFYAQGRRRAPLLRPAYLRVRGQSQPRLYGQHLACNIGGGAGHLCRSEGER